MAYLVNHQIVFTSLRRRLAPPRGGPLPPGGGVLAACERRPWAYGPWRHGRSRGAVMTLIPPPFDPELAAALAVVAELIQPSLTLEELAQARAGQGALLPSDEELRGDGALDIEERP